MESAFYRYYHVSKDCISQTWNTKEIESYLSSKGDFDNEGKGSYKHNTSFLSLQLMLVKDYNSWNSNDYNKTRTNYIVIITSKKLNPTVETFIQDFETFLGWRIIEETDDD